MDTGAVTICKFRPVMKSGVEGFLCGINIYTRYVTVSGATYPGIIFLLNGTTTLGGQTVNLNTDDAFYLVANNDPVTNPLATMSDGDYIEIQLTGQGATPTAAGIWCYFAMKYRLGA